MNEMLKMADHLEFDSKFNHLVGQRVEALDKNGKRHGGVLGFVGLNKFLGRFQVTLNRTPMFNIVLSTVKLQESKKIF